MIVVPRPTPEATPEELMVATPVSDEFHVTELVTFCVLPLVNVPVAVNCCVFPSETDGSAGVTDKEISAGAVTVKVVELLMDPREAWIVVPP